jgi:DNA polymerase-1
MDNTSAPLLILDVSSLAHRASFAPKGKPVDFTTAVLYGVLRDIGGLQDRFRTPRIAFCFDGGHDCRLGVFPRYKIARRQVVVNAEEDRRRREVKRQLAVLRDEILPALGFTNIFMTYGYEADDLVGSLVLDRDRAQEENVIVSSDRDLWQLIDGRTKVYNPRGAVLHTLQTFYKEWGIIPSRWVDVKALAGDGKGMVGDCIPGADRIGEITAAKYLRGEKTGHMSRLAAENWLRGEQYQINLKLIRLPFEGTPRLKLKEDETCRSLWHDVLGRYDMLEGLGQLLPLSAKRA